MHKISLIRQIAFWADRKKKEVVIRQYVFIFKYFLAYLWAKAMRYEAITIISILRNKHFYFWNDSIKVWSWYSKIRKQKVQFFVGLFGSVRLSIMWTHARAADFIWYFHHTVRTKYLFNVQCMYMLTAMCKIQWLYRLPSNSV